MIFITSGLVKHIRFVSCVGIPPGFSAVCMTGILVLFFWTTLESPLLTRPALKEKTLPYKAVFLCRVVR